MPGWTERDKDEGRALVRGFMRQASWVIDGNYTGFCQAERLEQADKIIYLNFPRFVCLFRVFRRYFQNRNATRESMAEGCTEKIDAEFIWWILYAGRTGKIRRHYREIISRYAYKAAVLKSQRQVDAYMKKAREAHMI